MSYFASTPTTSTVPSSYNQGQAPMSCDAPCKGSQSVRLISTASNNQKNAPSKISPEQRRERMLNIAADRVVTAIRNIVEGEARAYYTRRQNGEQLPSNQVVVFRNATNGESFEIRPATLLSTYVPSELNTSIEQLNSHERALYQTIWNRSLGTIRSLGAFYLSTLAACEPEYTPSAIECTIVQTGINTPPQTPFTSRILGATVLQAVREVGPRL